MYWATPVEAITQGSGRLNPALAAILRLASRIVKNKSDAEERT